MVDLWNFWLGTWKTGCVERNTTVTIHFCLTHITTGFDSEFFKHLSVFGFYLFLGTALLGFHTGDGSFPLCVFFEGNLFNLHLTGRFLQQVNTFFTAWNQMAVIQIILCARYLTWDFFFNWINKLLDFNPNCFPCHDLTLSSSAVKAKYMPKNQQCGSTLQLRTSCAWALHCRSLPTYCALLNHSSCLICPYIHLKKIECKFKWECLFGYQSLILI